MRDIIQTEMIEKTNTKTNKEEKMGMINPVQGYVMGIRSFNWFPLASVRDFVFVFLITPPPPPPTASTSYSQVGDG